MKYNLSEVKKLLERHLEKSLVNKMYTSKTIEARELLTSTRFDVAFKLLYLEIKSKNIEFAKEIYKEHIRAFSLGKFTEYGNKEKDSIRVFFKEFDDTFENINLNGFDNTKSLIPLSKNGSIVDGSHRLASAIFLNKNVECVNIKAYNPIYDYKFFYNRNISNGVLDMAATKFIEYSNNTYIAFIWPAAKGRDREIEKIISNVVYRTKVKLNLNGAHNLLSQIYYGEEWLGNIKNNFSGVRGKLTKCFKTFDAVKILVFQSENLSDVLDIKEKVRGIFDIGKHSIHITDTKEEAVRLARTIFNDNSIHFLNYAKPNKYFSIHKKIEKFKKLAIKNQFNMDDVLMCGGMTLSAYGLIEENGDDIFLNLKYNDKKLEGYCKEFKYYNKEKSDLIFNPKNYFYFNDVKFISFDQVYKIKKNNGKGENISDLKMMEELMESVKNKKTLNQWRQNLYYGRAKLRQRIVSLLNFFGLLNIIKKVLRDRQ